MEKHWRNLKERLSPETRKILLYFFGTRAFLFAVGILAVLYLPKFDYYQTHGISLLFDIWWKWDSGWYLSIVNDGYTYTPGQIGNTIWFPLYPLLIKLGSFLIESAAAAVIISHAALFAAVLFLYRLIKIDFGKKISGRAVLYMLIFPGSIFFSAIYSESLFLAMAAGSFYFARRGQWGMAGLFGYFAALTRSVGLIILPVLILEYALQKGLFKGWALKAGWMSRLDPKILWTLLVPAGTLTYAAYLFFRFGEPLAFLKTHALVGRELSFPFSSFFDSVLINQMQWLYVLGAAFAAFGLAMIVLMRKRLRPSYVLYAVLALMLPLSTGSLLGIHRYLIVIFPAFIMLALLAEKYKAHDYVISISTVLLAAYMVMFVNGWPIN